MLTENHLIKASNGLWRIWFGKEFVDYFPLTMSSHWIEWRLWHWNAGGYHFTNILLHTFTSIIFWRILLRLKIPGAWWAALIFAVHPVNVESVAWITERKNTLSLFFYAVSLHWFLKSEENAKTPTWYYFSLIAFTLSLLAKTATVALPCVLLGFAWWQRGKISKQDLLKTLPFFGIGIAMGLVTIWFQYTEAIAETAINTSTFAQRLAIAGRAVWFYVGKALVPIKLTFVYPRWEVDPANVLNYVPGVLVLVALAALWFAQKKTGRGPFFAFAYSVVALFPVLGFFNIYFQRYSFIADHWQYVAIIGVIALAASVIARLLKDKATFALGVAAIGCATLTYNQSKIYRNQETLWRDTLKKNPQCWMAESNWGLYLANQEPPRLDEAMAHYETALKIKPDDEGSLFNYGVALLHTGKTAEAAQKFQETLRVNPDHKRALASLAFIRAADRDPKLRSGEEAVRLAKRAVELTKEKDEWNLDTLAAAYAEAGQFDLAIKTQARAIEMAKAKNDSGAADDMEKRLRLFQSGKPVREGE